MNKQVDELPWLSGEAIAQANGDLLKLARTLNLPVAHIYRESAYHKCHQPPARLGFYGKAAPNRTIYLGEEIGEARDLLQKLADRRQEFEQQQKAVKKRKQSVKVVQATQPFVIRKPTAKVISLRDRLHNRNTPVIG